MIICAFCVSDLKCGNVCMCVLSVRPYVSLSDLIFFQKMIWWPKRAWKILKIKIWCPKRGDGGQKEPIMYILIDSELRIRSDV